MENELTRRTFVASLIGVCCLPKHFLCGQQQKRIDYTTQLQQHKDGLVLQYSEGWRGSLLVSQRLICTDCYKQPLFQAERLRIGLWTGDNLNGPDIKRLSTNPVYNRFEHLIDRHMREIHGIENHCDDWLHVGLSKTHSP